MRTALTSGRSLPGIIMTEYAANSRENVDLIPRGIGAPPCRWK